jgi:hypothetical protein
MSNRTRKSSDGAQPEAVSALAEPTPKTSSPAILNEHDVANVAYRRWVYRGCPQGSPEEDWFQAERELQSINRSS